LGEEYRSLSFSLGCFLQSPVTIFINSFKIINGLKIVFLCCV
jgi:hypothetical protein